MPNRYIKESIWTSPNLNKCSDLAERHFYRLLLATDDWGCFEITPPVVKGRCYPLKKNVAEKDIEIWNHELEENSVLRSWVEPDARLYAKFESFEQHNEFERHEPKTPCPPWLLVNGIDPRFSDKTKESFIRIEKAVKELSNNGHKPSHDDIAKEAHSSKSTVVRYFKQLKKGSTGGTDGGTDG